MNKHQMEAKQYLSQAFGISQRIQSKLEQIEEIRSLAAKMSTVYSDMPKNPNRNLHPMENSIVKFLDLEDELRYDISMLLALKKDIINRINAVNNADLQTVLELRYLSYMPWGDIASQLGYSVDNVYKLHRSALDKMTVPDDYLQSA